MTIVGHPSPSDVSGYDEHGSQKRCIACALIIDGSRPDSSYIAGLAVGIIDPTITPAFCCGHQQTFQLCVEEARAAAAKRDALKEGP
jgi:hypothetical protein